MKGLCKFLDMFLLYFKVYLCLSAGDVLCFIFLSNFQFSFIFFSFFLLFLGLCDYLVFINALNPFVFSTINFDVILLMHVRHACV